MNQSRRKLSRLLAAALAVTAAVSAAGAAAASPCGSFKDLDAADPTCKAVLSVQATRAIAGYPDGTFRPGAAVSRAEFAKMLTVVLGKPPTPGAALTFSDTRGHWLAAEGYLQTAVAVKAVTGYPDGTFRPDAQVTRAEVLTMVSGATGLGPTNATSFYEDARITTWFHAPVNGAARARLIGPNAVSPLWPGDMLSPERATTRAEAVTLLANWLTVKDSQGAQTPDQAWLPLRQAIESFVTELATKGFRTVERLTITELDTRRAEGTVEIEYHVAFEDRLTFKTPDEVPGLKGRLAYMRDHGDKLSAEMRARAESEINEWRKDLQGYIDDAAEGNMRMIARAPLSADGAVAPGAQVQLFMSAMQELVPAEQVLAGIPTAEAAEKAAYADMEQRYGKQQ